MPDDKEIIEGCKNGKESSQHALYKKYAGKMMGVCRRYIKSRAEAEDVFQDAFVKVFQKISSLKGQNLQAWMKRIFINACIDSYHKSRKFGYNVDYEEVQEVNFMFEDVFAKITNKELLQLINDIPEGYNIVFNLNVIEGYTHKEIAEMLGISEGTSKSQLAKAKKHLQRKLVKLDPKAYENR